MTEKTKKWTDEAVEQLQAIAGRETPVSADTVEKAADTLGFTVRSIASKLRQLDYDVASMAKQKTSTFSEEEGDALAGFVQDNANNLTYKEIAENFAGGKFSAKQVQGKLLALELTGLVKPAEKVEIARSYSEAEEAKFISMANGGSFIEDIAASLGKTVASVRGKALSLTRSGQISKIPSQKQSYANNTTDPITDLGDAIAGMTVAEIAAKVDKTERGTRTLLTRRGINVADYKGADKKAKAEAKKA